jgi:hypothetical protein
MIVWGGLTVNNIFNTGGRYNPATDSWKTTSTTKVPDHRSRHTAVWTGGEMIVWGGLNFPGTIYFNTGGRYDPVMDSWETTTTASTPGGRSWHTAVWTGTEMIIWGGDSGGNTGSRYLFIPPLAISPTNQSFPIPGGTGNINITAQGGCTWMATSNTSWLTITSGSSGAGNGTIAFNVAANPLIPRTGTITINNQTFTVTQAGEYPEPTLSRLQPNSAIAGNQSITLTVTGANFINGVTVVRWNGANRTTVFVNSTQLTAQIASSGAFEK